MDPELQSASPTKAESTDKTSLAELNFFDALGFVVAGSRITKREWDNPEIYGVLDGEILKIMKENGNLSNWIISEGDLVGEDWVVL